MPDEPVARLLYEQAAQALQDQRRSLDELRTRTGALLAASSISNAFLGAVAVHGSNTRAFHLPARYWLALAPFALSLAACIGILWYSSDWQFSLRSDIVKNLIPSGMPMSDIYSQLSGQLERMQDANDSRFRNRTYLFGFAAVTLLLSVVAWLLIVE
jgi:hypothetical protein